MNVKNLLFVAGSLFFTTVSSAQENDLSQIVSAMRENTKNILNLSQYETDDFLSVRFFPIFYEGKVVDISDLNDTSLEEISEIRMVFNDTVTFMFGNDGSKGVIIIEKLKSRQSQDQVKK